MSVVKFKIKAALALFICLAAQIPVTTPIPAREASECSNDEPSRKYYSLEFRGELLAGNSLRQAIFNEAARPHYDRLNRLATGLSREDPMHRELICSELDRLNATADDILSGGDGRGKPLLTPWKKHTPEEMVALRVELNKICGQNFENCHAQGAELEAQNALLVQQLQSGAIQYPAFVDKTTDNLQRLLETVTVPDRQ